MRILVTGGLGLLGSTLVDHLLKAGHSVRILDDFANNATVPADHDCETVRGSVCDNLGKAIQGVHAVVHLAAIPGIEAGADNPVTALEANVQGTLNLLRWATMEGVDSFVLASSVGAVLGTQVQPAREDQTPRPESVYGWSKLMAERIAGEFDHEMTVTVLRFTNMYGPYCLKKNSVISKLLLRKPDAPFTVYGDGKQTRDFIHTDDVSRAVMLAVEKQVPGLFHIGYGEGVSLLELVRTTEHVTGDHIPLDFQDKRPGDVLDNYTSITKATDVLGWKPEVELRDGIATTCRWLRESGHVRNASDYPVLRRQRMAEKLAGTSDGTA